MWQINRSGSARKLMTEAERLGGLDGAALADGTPIDRNTDLKVELHKRLLDLINLSALDTMSRQQVEVEVGEIVHEQLALQKHALNHDERKRLVADVLDELLGLGPLEPLLKDHSITDILVNTYDQVFVERHGRLEETPARFKDERHLLRIIQKIVGAVGRRIDESSPYVDARLADGSRVNAIIPPLAVDGALLSIRKFAKVPISMAKLGELGSVPATMAEVLKAIVAARRNILISGGTGSGKTTLLNAMSAYIDGAERIVTIEDSAELQLQQRHVARLETRPPNIEGKGEVTQRDLVKNALRMRPDRIILGEIRSSEALDMLQAMNTGHDGSMGTVHANTPREALTRLENMVAMSGVKLPSEAVRSQIAAAIQMIVQISRMRDGMRRITRLTEVVGMEGEIITTQDLFWYEFKGEDRAGKLAGEFRCSGLRPHFTPRAEYFGLDRALLEAVV